MRVWRYIVRGLLPLLLAVSIAAVRSPATSVAAVTAALSIRISGVASWANGSSYFNLRAAPATTARIVGTLSPGEVVRVTGAVQGGAVDGVSLWYRVRIGARIAYVLSTGIGYLHVPGRWTGVASTNGEDSVDAVASFAAPRAGAGSDGRFAPGTAITVLATVQGTALEPNNSVWYRVSIGSYRPTYIYSAYLKFQHLGAGPVPRPLITASAALAVDLDTLRVLYADKATLPWAPASLAKMMTAAVALDHLAPTTVLTVPIGAPSVGAAVGGSAMGLIPGEALTLHDLLYGMLLPSGNDAAYTIAQDVAGGQALFADMMNAKAAALGLRETHFVQGYGLDSDGQYSTAWDLARLARYDLDHYPLFAAIVRTPFYYIGPGPTHPAFALHNLNQLLGVYPGTFGVKTGTTPAAGENLVAAVWRDGHRVLVVVLGSADRYGDATALLNYAVATDLRAPGQNM